MTGTIRIHDSHLVKFCIENYVSLVIKESTRSNNILDLLFWSNILLLNQLEIRESFANSDQNSIYFDIFFKQRQFAEHSTRKQYDSNYLEYHD